MAKDGAGMARQQYRRSLVASAIVACLPLISSCVSAVDDTTAFGFSGTTAQKVASAAPANSSDAGKQGGAGASSTPSGHEGAAPASAAAGTPPSKAASAPSSESSLMLPASSHAASGKAIAAYAGATVGEGDGSSGDAPESANRSLFTSLFTNGKPRVPLGNVESGKSRRVVFRSGEEKQHFYDANLPGVDPTSLFEIGQKEAANEDAVGDVMSSYQEASLGGMARLGANGLMVQRNDVQTACFPQKLVGILHAIEQRFGKRIIITSGYRSPEHNRAVNGALHSQHMNCNAADVVIPDTDRFKVAAFVRALPGRGGVGTYCNTRAIHVDVGPKRDWNWRCRNPESEIAAR
ncbi:YcbK family protein [Jiella sp. M17.18]|uniref:YcbK family protein n=1 Tax=Jiella sp. M17.18 TaxID=3234247 RepID=UPI0034DEA45C